MKNNTILLVIILIMITVTTWSQENEQKPQNGFVFPIGTKFTIKLHETDSSGFDYSVINYEPFDKIIDRFEDDTLFSENGQEGTIEFYFCFSTYGDTESEKEENMNVVLMFKNRTEYSLSYKSDILTEEDGVFEETSNVGSYAGVIMTENWPYMIYQIALYDFKNIEKQ